MPQLRYSKGLSHTALEIASEEAVSAVRREIAPLLAYEGAKYDFYSSSWEHLVSFYLPLGN